MSTETTDPAAATLGARSCREGPEALHKEEDKPDKGEVSEPKGPTLHSSLLAALQDSSLSGLRDHRSSSDAYVHAVSRSRAAAVAALAKASSGQLQPGGCRECRLHHHQQHQHHQHHHQQQQNPLLLPLLHQHLDPLHKNCSLHHSQGSLPSVNRAGTSWSVCSGAKPSPTQRCHSQSSLARLKVKPHPHPDPHHSRSTSSLSHSRRATGPEEEVTYVWRQGRVQVQQPPAARNGLGYSEHRTSLGQHVQYLWQGGNVQKVIRGPNNETLATEMVPPRGQVKGVNYCIIYCLLIVFVITIVALVFVLKVLY